MTDRRGDHGGVDVEISLRGLAVGDAFGEQWFSVPSTDDTAMALSLVAVLRECGEVDQDALASRFAESYRDDPHRKYGGSMHQVLQAIGDGAGWRVVTTGMFDGLGSWGNGAAMRVAPWGVWFADGPGAVVEQARAQAVVTHAHPEAAAGAVAVAAALAVRGVAGQDLIPGVLEHVPDGEVASGLRRATRLRFGLDPRYAAGTLGCGLRISAADTVPYARCGARTAASMICPKRCGRRCRRVGTRTRRARSWAASSRPDRARADSGGVVLGTAARPRIARPLPP